MTCPSCAREIGDDSDFCPACGHLLIEDAALACKKHGSRRAVSVCIICSEPVCSSCSRTVDKRTFCDEHDRITVEQDWALAYESSELNDAELARAVLEEAGFNVVVRDFSPIGYVWDGSGDSAFSRTALKKQAKVFVPIGDVLRARDTLDEWAGGQESGDPDS